MKKLFVIALAAIGMAACTQEELVSIKGGDAIVFDDAFLDNATRAAADPSITTANIDGFNVWAFMDDVNGTVFEAEEVTKSGDAWTYAHTQYWAPSHNYYFAALAPINGNWTLNTANASTLGAGIVNFINADGGEDLIYAKQFVSTPADINAQPAAVKLQFQHLLSKVKFTFQNGFTNDNAKVVVKDIKMSAAAAGSIDLAVADYAKGWVLSGDAVYAFGDLEATIGRGAKAESANERLMIPASADYRYNIEFTVELYMGEQLAQTFNETTQLTGVELEMGKAYNFSAVLNAANLGLYPITFDVVVDEWVNAGDVTVDPRVVYVNNQAELQAALDNATAEAGYNIIINDNIAGDVVATQKNGVNIIINGNNKEYNGSIYVNGQSSTSTAKSLTIKDLNFVTADAERIFIGSQYGNNTDRYARNVTIEGCTFTGSGVASDVVAVKFYQTYDLAIVGCQATEVHSLAQVSSSTNVTITDCTVDGGRGVNMGNSANGSVVINNLTATAHEADGYGVRIYTAGNGKVATIENSNLNAFAPIVLKTNVDYTLYVNNSTLTATGSEQIVKEAKHVVLVDGFPYGAILVNNATELTDALAVDGEKTIVLLADKFDGTYKMTNNTTILGNGKEVGSIDLNGAENVTLKDITFDVANAVVFTDGKNNKGVASISSGSANSNKGANNVVIDGCVFKGDFAGSGVGIGLGDQYRNSGKTGNVTIKNCTFNMGSGCNYEIYGHYTGKGSFVIENNTFASTTHPQGKSIYLGRYQSNTPVVVKGNTFEKKASAAQAMYIQAHSSEYTVSFDASDNTYAE